jgi:hypothetical protein
MASELEQKPNLIPHCDVHPEAQMVRVTAQFFDIGATEPSLAATSYRCSYPGCEKFFGQNFGYQTRGHPPQDNPVRCVAHGPVRPFMVVVPAGFQSMQYVCPVQGCDQTRPWPQSKGE